MPLPPGRKPLTDKDMANLLYNMAISLMPRDETLAQDLRDTADRFNELSQQKTKNEQF